MNFVFLDFLLGGVEFFFKANHKLTHRLFPVMNWHRPALADIVLGVRSQYCSVRQFSCRFFALALEAEEVVEACNRTGCSAPRRGHG